LTIDLEDGGEPTEGLPEQRHPLGAGAEQSTVAYAPDNQPTASSPAGARGAVPRLAAGDLLTGRFVILRFIARGGMGEVYEALDNELGSRVAVKTILPASAGDPGVAERFRREVLLARRVTHANVCRVFELYSSETPAGEALKFLTMEFLDGESLAQRLTRVGRVSPGEALPLLRQMVAALGAAHAQGIVHRDFKPSNVMLVPLGNSAAGDSGGVRAVVTDFGIARALVVAPENEGTQTGAVVGTPQYMAPEQVTGGTITAATDIYALGVVMHEMVTGKLPFTGDTALAAPPRGGAPQPTTLRLDSRWSAAVARCLAREPERRFNSVLDVIPALDRASRGTRRRWVAGALLATAALGVLGWVALHRPGGTMPATTLAVLPFRSIGTEPATHLGLGIADAVIGRLATSRKLTVRPTSAISRFEEERSDAMEAGRQLRVDAVVEGTVRQVEGGTRVLVQLTDVGRGAIVWSDQLDLPQGRLFELEDAIITRLVDHLRIKLDASGRNTPGRSVPIADAPLQRYLAASSQLSEPYRLGDERGRNVVAQLDSVVHDEPGFAPAIAARAYARAWLNYFSPTPGGPEAVLRDAAQALALDPELPLPHVARAVAFWSPHGGWRFVDAVRELQAAAKLSPGADIPHLDLVRTFFHRGWFQDAREELREARRLDPLSNGVALLAATILRFDGHPREALGQFGQMPKERIHGQMLHTRLQLENPNEPLADIEAWVREEPAPIPLALLAIARARMGSRDIAQLEQRALATNQEAGHFHHVFHLLADAHAQMRDTQQAVEYLRRASETGFPCLPCFDKDLLLAPVHGSPEYAALRADLLRKSDEDRASLSTSEQPASARPP